MRAASDVGGTFTDLVYYEVDPVTGRCGPVKTAKTDTTTPRFEEGVMNTFQKVGLSPASLEFFAHGTTVVINAITERKGAKTALITTLGFRDVLEIARGNRPDLFNFNFRKPRPFVERRLRVEIDERVNHKGEIQKEADLSALQKLLDCFRSEGVEAIAVCFLHAYINPENERRTVDKIRELWPQVSVLASHRISREWREYERTNTTVLSAYVHPVAKKYIESLESKLEADGFKNRCHMMHSNGGMSTAEAAKGNPISMVESGPASGIFAAAYLGRVIGKNNLIVLDIGGTTAKCTLVENGNIKVTTEYHIEKTRTNPGYPIQTPVSEIVEIGNGGGSIAWIDEGGKFRVGPQSAGAMPGPAAYGRGGSRPTTTDANLILGRIDPKSFVGGEIEPDWKAINAAFTPLAKQLGTSIEETARGVIRVANANMANALRLVSVNKGFDPRDFVLIAFGGGGAMHAVALAEELRVPRVIVPVNSAVFSAWGMLLTDLRRDYLLTQPLTLSTEQADSVASTFAEMEAWAKKDFAGDDIDMASAASHNEFFVDMRYSGQEHTVKVAFPDDGCGQLDIRGCIEAFHQMHEKRFTYRLENEVQIVDFHLVATVEISKPDMAKKAITGRALAETVIGTRKVDFDQHGIHTATIYDGLRFEFGMQVVGPAVIQEPSVTLVVPPGHQLTVDEYGNYHVIMSYAGAHHG